MTRLVRNRRTREQIEEIVNNLGYYLLDEYINEKVRRVVVQGMSGYKYDVILHNLISGLIPNFVGKNNPYTLENIVLWLKLNEPEFKLCEDNEYKGCHENLNFFHDIEKCQEYFEMSWANISSGQGCSVCHGKQVGEKTSLAYLRPDLAEEWHPDNEMSPYDVPEFCNKMAYWICSTCGYGENREWYSVISSRANGRGCKKCSDERGESLIASKLKKYFIDNYKAKDEYKILINPETGYFLPYDIYLFGGESPKINGTYIEIHWDHHYKLSAWHIMAAKKNGTTQQEEFEYQKKKDRMKRKFARKNGTYIEIDLRKIKAAEEAIEYIEKRIE